MLSEKILFQKSSMVFSLPSLTPRPPVWQKTIKNTVFFFGTLPLFCINSQCLLKYYTSKYHIKVAQLLSGALHSLHSGTDCRVALPGNRFSRPQPPPGKQTQTCCRNPRLKFKYPTLALTSFWQAVSKDSNSSTHLNDQA